VKISAKPEIIPADGVSTSTIRVIVTWPNETELSGEPAANQTLTMWTDCGLLFEATNESNTGRSINVTTDDNGTATALLSGNETCNATVAVKCLSGGWNSTQVSFVAPASSYSYPYTGSSITAIRNCYCYSHSSCYNTCSTRIRGCVHCRVSVSGNRNRLSAEKIEYRI